MTPADQPNQGFLLVSDVDDTVKITHVVSRPRAALRGLFRGAVFSGMATLYRELATRLVFLSASPTSLENRLRRTLVEGAGFPEARFILRDWLRDRDTGAFKRETLRMLAEQTPARLILVGDDTENDPELFVELATGVEPGKVAAIYIRRNLHRELPAGAIPFLTAHEIAEREWEAGRLSAEAVLRVGEATLVGAGRRGHRLYPPFYPWPDAALTGEPRPQLHDARLIEMRARIRATTEAIFAARSMITEQDSAPMV